ncbi:hypothetical protein QUA80_17510 [Microcoleus sp. F4-D5]
MWNFYYVIFTNYTVIAVKGYLEWLSRFQVLAGNVRFCGSAGSTKQADRASRGIPSFSLERWNTTIGGSSYFGR